MFVAISSNVKKHFKNYCDFLDYHWLNFFIKKKYKFLILPNSLLAAKYLLETNSKKIKLVILPGGNDINDKIDVVKRNKVEKSIIKFSIKNKIPLLGVCRGMQLVNIYFGGKIRLKKNHMRTNHLVFLIKIQSSKRKKIVNSFHNYCIEKKDLGRNLEIIAECKDQTIEFLNIKI